MNETNEKKPISVSFCLPHALVSREVLSKEDGERVRNTKEAMQHLCYRTWGFHKGAYAIAHSQVDDKDPLRFFVTARGDVIVNPVIDRHTKVPVTREEGCMTFPYYKRQKVQRYNKVEVTFYRYTGGEDLQGPFTESLSGIDAQVIQHEIDHMDGKYLYPIPHDPAEAHKQPSKS